MTPARKIALGAGGALAAIGALGVLATRSGAASSSSTGSATSSRFAGAVLLRARADLGVLETSANSGARVDAMLRNVGVNFPANWCAAAVATWVKEAAQSFGVASPIAGSASVLVTVSQFQDAKNTRVGWLDAAELRANPSLIVPGLVVAWSRGVPGSGLGHIGIVESGASGGTFGHIDGNAGAGADRVAQGRAELASGALLGMGFFHDAAIFASPRVGLGYLNDPPGAPLFPVV